MTDNEIIQEATEAVEKNLNAGCYVEDLLRIIKEKNAEIERLKDQAYINNYCDLVVNEASIDNVYR